MRYILVSLTLYPLLMTPVAAQTYCDARGCALPDHLGDLRIMIDFISRSGIRLRQTNCNPGLLGIFSPNPPNIGTMTICSSAFKAGVSGVRETVQHEMVHAAQFCRARNNGKKGFMTIHNDSRMILRNSYISGTFRHAGGAYGRLIEHEAYTYESARPRDVLLWFNKYCIERKRSE